MRWWLAVVVVLAAGCGREPCPVGYFRCDGSTWQKCSDAGEWETFSACGEEARACVSDKVACGGFPVCCL